MIILRLLLLLTNLHLKLLSTQGTGADKLLSTQRVKPMILKCNNIISLVLKCFLMCSIEFLVLFYYKNTIISSFLDVTNHVLQLNPHCLIRFLSHFDKILSDFSI